MPNLSVAQSAERIAKQHLPQEYELVDVEFKKEGSQWNLYVFIDKDGGITWDDCETVTRILDPLFDADPVVCNKHDMLIVSSPGLDRHLKKDRDFEKRIGDQLTVRLFVPLEGEKQLQGVLERFDAENIYLSCNKKTYAIDRKNIAAAQLYIKF